MSIRLIACDVDGTLVGPDHVFSPRLLAAIRRAHELGITLTLATGRGFPSARIFARQLGITAPLICYQGAQIKSPAGETLYESTLPRQYLPEVIDFCRERQRELTLYCNDEIYQTTRLYSQEYYDLWFGLPIHHVQDLLSAVPDGMIKFIIIAPTEQEGDRLQEELKELAAGRFQVTRSHAWFVEGLARGVSKGDALARLARSMGLAREEVMAMGDSGNDASMVEWAGLGVAVGNASPEVKAVADVIAPPLAEDGAAWTIERYALGENHGS